MRDRKLYDDIAAYVEENIGIFHDKRIEKLGKLRLIEVIKRKNPYLFKAKNIMTPEQFVTNIINAYISSQEETIFGDWLEGLAVFINKRVFDGWKSGITGIDLEFDSNNIRYIVNIKSGPNWGNSSQIQKMRDDFRRAVKTLKSSRSGIIVQPVNGCCYGRSNTEKGDYIKICGQKFWEFISGEKELYIDIIEPLGKNAKIKNDDYMESYYQIIVKFSEEFSNIFCVDHKISWERIVKFNSSE